MVDHLLLDNILPLASFLYEVDILHLRLRFPARGHKLKFGTSKAEGRDMLPSRWQQAAGWLLLPQFVGRESAQVEAVVADSAPVARCSLVVLYPYMSSLHPEATNMSSLHPEATMLK